MKRMNHARASSSAQRGRPMVMISVGQRWIHPRRRRHAALHQRPAFVLLAPLPVAVVTLRTAQSAHTWFVPFQSNTSTPPPFHSNQPQSSVNRRFSMLKSALSHVSDAAWRCSCGVRCACERIFNLHVEQHDTDIDCSHPSGWPARHFATAPGALALQPGIIARNTHDHSLFLLLQCISGSHHARDIVANSQSRCVSGINRRVSVMAAIDGELWRSWTGALPPAMKDFPSKASCDGEQLFPAQSSHNMLFAIKCDNAADGQAAADSILADMGDHVVNRLLVRGFKFDGGKDLTGACPCACA